MSLLLLATAGAACADADIAALRNKLAPAIACLDRFDVQMEDHLATYAAVAAQLARNPRAFVAYVGFRIAPYGAGEDRAVEACESGLDAMAKAAPAMPDLDAAAADYAAALRPLMPALRDAEPYYTQRDYADDGFARGRQIDARLSPLLARFAAAAARLTALAGREEMRLRQAELAAIEAADGGRSLRFDTVAAMVDARYAVNLVGQALRDHTLSGAVLAQAAAPLQSLLDEGAAREAAHPEEAAGFPLWGFAHEMLGTFLATVKQFRRTLEARVRLDHLEEDATSVRERFNSVAEIYNLRGEMDPVTTTPLVSPVILAAAGLPTRGAALLDRPVVPVAPALAAMPPPSAPAAAASNPLQSAPPQSAVPREAGRRVALVIGNGGYRAVPRLANPRNDANLVAAALAQRGFTLIGGGAMLDLDKPALDQAVRRFGAALEGADVGLFYYAGHGVQIGGQNYLVPVDANPTGERDVDFTLLNVQIVLRQLESAHTRLSLVLLDACRNNPFAGRGLRSAGGGLAEMQAPAGTLISYATQPGNVAQDGAVDSPYTTALIRAMQERGLGLFDLFNEVGLLVKDATDGEQQPWLAASPIQGRFYFTTP